MKAALVGLLTLSLAYAVFTVQSGGAQDKDKKGVTALPPHKLDPVFDKAKSEDAVIKELMKNALFKKAVADALKAKADQEARYKENPMLRDATPAQAARRKFLEVLNDQK